MLVSPLALVIDSLIIPFIAGLPSLATAMIFVLIITPIMTIVKPIVTELLEKLFSNKYKSNEIIMKKIGGSVNNK
jgi:antibiotic biosynthesis monooxygenase (ABM) superfamily enzyme